jgi:hypothetical protein
VHLSGRARSGRGRSGKGHQKAGRDRCTQRDDPASHLRFPPPGYRRDLRGARSATAAAWSRGQPPVVGQPRFFRGPSRPVAAVCGHENPMRGRGSRLGLSLPHCGGAGMAGQPHLRCQYPGSLLAYAIGSVPEVNARGFALGIGEPVMVGPAETVKQPRARSLAAARRSWRRTSLLVQEAGRSSAAERRRWAWSRHHPCSTRYRARQAVPVRLTGEVQSSNVATRHMPMAMTCDSAYPARCGAAPLASPTPAWAEACCAYISRGGEA